MSLSFHLYLYLHLHLRVCIVFLILSYFFSSVSCDNFSVTVISISSHPILSYIDGTSSFQQVFNPSFVTPSCAVSRNSPYGGLLVRSQNCTIDIGTGCHQCGGADLAASRLTFSPFRQDGTIEPITDKSIVFGPHNDNDSCGTEDPRIAYNPFDETYYLFYTAYNCVVPYLYLATSHDPTNPDPRAWTVHGAVFPNHPGSKSAALLLSINATGPHHLLWGDDVIRIAKSNLPSVWPDPGTILISPRDDYFDSGLVESGPPPLRLSTGDYIFFYNSATKGWPLTGGYHPGYLILDGHDPSIILQRSDVPLLSPDQTWTKGTTPYTCNAPNVVFLEAAQAKGNDTFRVWFGGADAVVGEATIQVAII